MPNHVTNVISAVPAVLEALLSVGEDGEKFIDFNTMIPIPDDDDPRITSTKTDYGNGMVGWSFDGISPMDFQRDLWGTKWNAYSQEIDTEFLKFETAWSHPLNVIVVLSLAFPEETIVVRYADEDLGHNLGYYSILNGEITHRVEFEAGSEKALDFACRLRYGVSYEEQRKVWFQDDLDSARSFAFWNQIKEERDFEDSSEFRTLLREGSLTVPEEIVNSIQTQEDIDNFWKSA